MAETQSRGLPRLIVLEGSPSEMGLLHGRALAEEIRLLVKHVDRFVFRPLGPVRALGVRVLAHTLASIMARRAPERFQLEMRALAHGSRVGYSSILLMNTLDDVLNILRRFAPRRTAGLACSSFALMSPRSWDGNLMHGRNLDYHFRGTPLDDGGEVARLIQRKSMLFLCRPDHHTSFVSIGWPGVAGVTTALSREGISLGNLTSYLRGTTPFGVPTGLLYRQVIEEASDLAGAAGVLRASNRTIGNNLMVGSGRENSAALFEITAHAVAELVPANGALVSTNHFVTPALKRRQRPFLLPHSVTRWERLQEMIGRSTATSMEDALGYLADVECGGETGDSFICVGNQGTAVSVLFRPVQMEMWLGINDRPPASRGEFRPVDVDALLSGAAVAQSARDTGQHGTA